MAVSNQNLKYLRKLRGWTQEEFAQKLRIKRSLLGAYEEERAEPRIDVLEVVCDIFKLTLDDLLRDHDRELNRFGANLLEGTGRFELNLPLGVADHRIGLGARLVLHLGAQTGALRTPVPGGVGWTFAARVSRRRGARTG